MNRRRVFTAAGCAVALALCVVPSAVRSSVFAGRPQAPADRGTPRIVGTWKLDPERSNVRVPPRYTEIRDYRLRPDGYLVGLLITGTAQGYHYLQFVARSDGQDYPEYSDQIVADIVTAGRPTPRTYAERAIDDSVTEWTDKLDGRVTARGKKIVSMDGTTLTITVEGASTVRVYERQ